MITLKKIQGGERIIIFVTLGGKSVEIEMTIEQWSAFIVHHKSEIESVNFKPSILGL